VHCMYYGRWDYGRKKVSNLPSDPKLVNARSISINKVTVALFLLKSSTLLTNACVVKCSFLKP
jgi:hypothetical protein